MKKLLIILLILISISLINGLCEEGQINQININTATKQELDELSGVGEKIAQNIIDARPFESVEDLINVNRIGEITLQKILNQGLACVKNEEKQKIEGITEEEITNQFLIKKN